MELDDALRSERASPPLTSDAAVDVSFANGSVRSNGIEISGGGTRILFLKGVKATFNAGSAKGDAQP